MKKFKHKETDYVAIKSQNSLNYAVTGPSICFNLPSNIVETGSDWVEIKEKLASSLNPDSMQATRISDGRIFTLRDMVRGQIASNVWVEGPILSFEWEEAAYDVRLMAQVGVHKIALEHLEKAILTTTDGVSIFDADTVVHCILGTGWIPSSNRVGFYLIRKDRKFFSTKEARLDYIARNKPLFSLEDIYDSAHLSVLEAGNLIIKAKEKLKENDSNL